jgi:hypothetical protein
MHRFYSVANPRSSGQLQSLSHYRDSELQRKQNPVDGAVDADGSLLEYEALELRLHPPNVRRCCILEGCGRTSHSSGSSSSSS